MKAQGFRKVDPAALEQFINSSGVDFRPTNRSYVFTCPRCSKAKKLMMFKADGRFICWVCAENQGFKGRPEYALTELTGVSIKEIQRQIYGDSFDQLPTDYLDIQLRDFFEDEPQELAAKHRPKAWPLDFYPMDHQHARRGLEYLQGRGIDLELAMAYDLRYCPVQRRVIFPVKVGGSLMGWQARAIFDTEWEDEDGNVFKAPKILTTGDRDAQLMFQDRLAGMEHAVLAEGPVDGIKCHLAGGNVVTMGKVVARKHIEILRNSGVKRLYLAQDPDAATETMRLCQDFGDLELYRVLPPEGYEDLGEAPLELVRDQIFSAPRIYAGQVFTYLVDPFAGFGRA